MRASRAATALGPVRSWRVKAGLRDSKRHRDRAEHRKDDDKRTRRDR